MKRRSSPRICDICRKPYHRRNLVETWTTTNLGHRDGWQKAMQKICCLCMEAGDAQDLMRDLNPRWKPTVPKKARST